MVPDKETLNSLREALLLWFDGEGRRYPWRDDRSPYSVLVSEFMLQQTRIATVLDRGYYTNWMRAFPDWDALAQAPEPDILKAWEGLGYYNRARNLQKTAQVISGERDGIVPKCRAEWLQMPGVGAYTAAAVASIAMGETCGVVDGNVERVFARFFSYDQPIATPASKKLFQDISDQLVCPARPGDWNAAIMELGQFVCTRSKPRCSDCPLQGGCQALRRGEVERLPVKIKKPAPERKREQVGLCRKGNLVLFVKETSSRRKGLLRLPSLEELGIAEGTWVQVDHFDYAITKYKVDLEVFCQGTREYDPSVNEPPFDQEEQCWIDPFQAGRDWPAMGAPYKKALLRHLERQQEMFPDIR